MPAHQDEAAEADEPCTCHRCEHCGHTLPESLAMIDAEDPPNTPPMVTESSNLWRLDNVEQHPDTFVIPHIMQRRSLRRNQVVKVIFELVHESAPRERMFVTVDAVRTYCPGKTYYTGTLRNEPLVMPMQPGDSVYFDSSHVCEISPDDDSDEDETDMEEE